ncbi:hypothetical protein C8R43DRAFT_1136892 [Mycena crocata]|nr:hypothetical protein C8R43DRAFT_1136892 [Mycena crocata]
MSSKKKNHSPFAPLGPEEEKRKRHAKAQREYRNRNLEATRAKARERMADLRSRIQSPKQRYLARKNRRKTDADYREQLRRQKFVAEFGHEAFLEFYYPQYKICGTPHLAGVRTPWEEAAANKAECEKKKKRKARRNAAHAK